MLSRTAPESRTAFSPSPLDAVANLRQVAPRLPEMDSDALLEILPELSSAIGKIVDEHQGMADELLCVYEQLGIIFEVTRKLASANDESELLGLFVGSLRRSFERRTVQVYMPWKNGEWDSLDGSASIPPRLAEILARSSSLRGAMVVPPSAENPEGDAELMISPVQCGDTLAAVLVLTNHPSAPPFKASELMLIESLTRLCGDVIRGHRLVRELRTMSVAMVRSLVSAVDQKDEYTCGHSLRVAYYATALGRQVGKSKSELQMLQWGALLHDVGKIGIRDEVLKKEGKLTPEEFGHIKEHPVRSHKVVQQVPQLARALDGILHHHERFDGSGYPSGLSGEAIPLDARIIQIADVFDALTSNRSYRQAYGWEDALRIMNTEAGKTIDPRLTSVFDCWIREQVGPNGTGWSTLVALAGRADEELAP